MSFMGVRISRFGRAHVAQLAEHVLGKDEVISSILIMGSILDRVCAEVIWQIANLVKYEITNTRR